MAISLKLPRSGASLLANILGVGFIDWLGLICEYSIPPVRTYNSLSAGPDISRNICELCRDQCADPDSKESPEWSAESPVAGSARGRIL